MSNVLSERFHFFRPATDCPGPCLDRELLPLLPLPRPPLVVPGAAVWVLVLGAAPLPTRLAPLLGLAGPPMSPGMPTKRRGMCYLLGLVFTLCRL